MLQALFTSLTRAVEASPGIALLGSLVWGALSVVLSPCHLASIPLIVGYIAGQQELTSRRALRIATAFAFGTLLTIAAIGVITALLGRITGDIGGIGNYLVAGIFFLIGLHLLDVIPLPVTGSRQRTISRKGVLTAFLLGLVSGMALGPCTFAFMAPVLGAGFRFAASAPVYAALLLAAYGMGHCGVIILAGASAERVQRLLNWNEHSRAASVLRKVCGTLVLLGGLYFIYTAA